MADSAADPLQVSEYRSRNWIFKCTSWQYDRILDRYQFKRGSWTGRPYCNQSDPSGNPRDIIVIQLRHRIGGCHVLPICYWIRKDVLVGNEVDPYKMNCINSELSRIFEKMNPEGTYVKSHMVQEVKEVARTLASMPRNAGREGLSFVYEVSALPASSRVVIDSLPRVKFLGDVEETQTCVVCLDEISKGEEIIWMPCLHIYHGKCILSWLDRKPTCPTCGLMVLPMDS